MGYLAESRKYVGHAPLLMVGATVLIVDPQERLLLMKRTDNECWGPPGGAVEPGEVVEEAARRETHEETGLEISEMSLFGVFSGPDQYYRYPGGDEVHNVTIVYLCRNVHGEVRLSDEHTDWDWFAVSAIPENLSPPIKPVIQQYKNTFSSLDT
jgi:ADP-ribose pyrophosphatase YjhB (NUDIX family)